MLRSSSQQCYFANAALASVDGLRSVFGLPDDAAKKTIVCAAFCFILGRSARNRRRDHTLAMPLSAGVEGAYISLRATNPGL